MRLALLNVIKRIPWHRGSAIVGISILLGLILSRFTIASPTAGIIVLSFGIALAFAVLLRKIDYLIFSWLILTSLIWFILPRLLPPHYHGLVGRGIFWGLLACIIVAWAMDNVLSRSKFTPFDNVPIKATILVFLLWGTMTLFTSIDVFNSVRKFSHIVIGLVASYMFYDFFSRDENNIRKMFEILFFLVLTVSLLTVAVAGYSLLSGKVLYKQITLWFTNPNSLGYFLFVSIPVLIATQFHFMSNKGIRFSLLTTMLLALFFSFARTSWLATLVSIMFLLWKGRRKIPVLAATVTCLFIVGLLVPVVGGDFYNYITGERYTGRKEIWKASWNVACDYPVLGTGPGTTLRVLPDYISTPWLKNVDTHSVYLKNAIEMGFISVVIVLVFYIVFFYYSDRIERSLKSEYLKLVTRGATATLLGVFFHGIFENGFLLTTFDAAEFTVLFPYILIGLPFAAKRLDKK